MNKSKTERRVINIKKEDYDFIKEYCQKNNLKISDWVGSEIKKLILNKTN